MKTLDTPSKRDSQYILLIYEKIKHVAKNARERKNVFKNIDSLSENVPIFFNTFVNNFWICNCIHRIFEYS